MTRQVPLAMDAAEFRAAGHRLIDQLADLLEAVPGLPVTPGETSAQVRAALGLGGPLPEQGEAAGPLLERITRQLAEHSLFNGHPRFFGYITSSPAPIGMLGDLVAAAINPNVGGWTLSPAATEVEAESVRWIAELIGYPAGAGGLLVSGGNMANIACFMAARAAKTPWDVRAKGVAGDPGRRLRLYTSSETHTWIQKAADLAGLGTEAVRWIPADSEQRMDMTRLAAQIAADRRDGDLPFLVIGTGGSVSTGAIDPLPAIAALCREQDLWFHVDGAYGGFAAALPDAPADLRALALADSVAVDPHKWLYVPMEAGCALVRDHEKLRNAFSYHPPYYRFQDETLNYVDYGPQNSRGFRALKVWLALRHAGAAGYRTMIADDVALSRRMAEAVRRHDELELVTQSLSIATFRYVPKDLRARIGDPIVEGYLFELNAELAGRVQKSGRLFLSNAVVNGRYLLRACIVNFNTLDRDVDAVPEITARLGREADAELRASGKGAAATLATAPQSGRTS